MRKVYYLGARYVLPQNFNIFDLHLDVRYHLMTIWIFVYLVYVRKAKDNNIYYNVCKHSPK